MQMKPIPHMAVDAVHSPTSVEEEMTNNRTKKKKIRKEKKQDDDDSDDQEVKEDEVEEELNTNRTPIEDNLKSPFFN